MFCFRILWFCDLTFKFLVHFEFIPVYGVRGHPNLWGHIKIISHWKWCLPNLQNGSKHFASTLLSSCLTRVQDKNLQGRCAPKVPSVSSTPSPTWSWAQKGRGHWDFGRQTKTVSPWGWCWLRLQEEGKTDPHSEVIQLIDCLSVHREFLQRKSVPKYLLGAANRLFCRTQVWQSGVASTWKTRIVRSPGLCCRYRSPGPWKDGGWGWCGVKTQTGTSVADAPEISSRHAHLLFMTPICPDLCSFYQSPGWVSESKSFRDGPFTVHLGFWRTHSFSRLTDRLLIFTAKSYADSFSQPWCSGLGIPVWGWDIHPLRDIPLASQPLARGCRGQPSPYLHTSYGCLCGYF